jgi:hypothetical protein
MGETATGGKREGAEQERLVFLFRMLKSAREIGRLEGAAHYVKKIEDGYGGNLTTEQADLLKSAQEWVEWAIEYEQVNGKESILNRSHPTHLRALKMLGMTPAAA